MIQAMLAPAKDIVNMLDTVQAIVPHPAVAVSTRSLVDMLILMSVGAVGSLSGEGMQKAN